MALYIQHGHGKAEKINDALTEQTAQGVIFGARNEKPDRLLQCMASLESDFECELLFDPQFYVATMTPASDKYLPDYPYYRAALTASDLTGRRIEHFVRAAIDFQRELPVTRIVAPTVVFDSFADRWYQIALGFADASIEYHASLPRAKPLLLSFAFAEEALTAEDDIGRFLDTVTQDGWDMAGFYLIAARHDGTYGQRFDSTRLANYLYIVHALGEVNGLEVVCGYADFVGIALRAAGADAFACGWSHLLRHFHRKNFLQRKPGGQTPRPRYSSGPLLNSVFVETELEEIFEVDHLQDVLSGVPLDALITRASSPANADWSLSRSQHHHWQTLHKLDEQLTGQYRTDIRETRRRIRDAHALYGLLEQAGVRFERSTSKDHLPEWSRALSEFARRMGLSS
jgi:hypothetical protein